MTIVKRAVKIFLLAAVICAAAVTAAACGSTSTVSTIYYDTDGGTTVQPITAKKGSRVYPPDDPEKDGFRFGGWTLNGEEYVFEFMPQNDITLKAEWKKLFVVSFDTGEDATQIADAEYAEGERILFPDEPQRDGYKFAGWTLDGADFAGGAMESGDITLTAKWKITYKITFDTSGVAGLDIAPIVEEAGAAIAPPLVNDCGYYAVNWLNKGTVFNFDVMPEENLTLTAKWEKLTNLPAMFINLYNSAGGEYPLTSVNRENYVSAKLTLTNVEDGYALNYLNAEFRGRGNGSWNECDKKGYKLKFEKKQSLFGRTKNKHWVLLACANFNDVTMNRNHLAYGMGRELFDNIEFTTDTHWVDLYVNGNYHGVYLLAEHTRVATGRVDIESEYSATNQDTGYLIEYDAYASGTEGVDYFRIDGVKYAFTVHSPDPEDYQTEGGLTVGEYRRHVSYIKDYVSRVYAAALSGNYTTFANLADVDSFVDMYILHELFKNIDTGYSSFYLYKKAGGKLYAGPPWDFDATTNFDAGFNRGDRSPEGIFVAGAVQNDNSHCASELYIALYKNASFKSAVKARWKTLAPQISAYVEEHLNDGVYAEYRAAMGKNFAKWTGKTQSRAESDWVNDMKALKTWLTTRIAWLTREWR